MFGLNRDRLSSKTWAEISARYANLLVHCYKKRDVNGIQVSITALTHLCYSVNGVDRLDLKAKVARQFIDFVGREADFPSEELPYVEWLVNHFFEIEQSQPAEYMLPWYQQLDDEWLVRKQLKDACPDKNSTELTAMMLYQAKKQGQDQAKKQGQDQAKKQGQKNEA